jgi:exosortase A
MNAPTLDGAGMFEVAVSLAVREWRRVALPLGLGLLLLGGLFSREVATAVQTWQDSTAYNHCFLVIPIALYLLWDRRFDLARIPPCPAPTVVLLGLPLALIWLAAERLGIMEGRQLVAISFVELLFLGVLGFRLWWSMAGPLLYLYFLVPSGAFLTPGLQDFTTWFIRNGLELLGIPAYIDGYVIEIPQGTFFVAEACAGLRFLIASLAFGCLYALMMYRSPLRRTVFILVSVIVPIIANGLRGLGIVYLGYLLNSAEAAAADHIIYGWLFFSAIILLLIAFGLPFRQDEISTRSAATPARQQAPPGSMFRAVATSLSLIMVAAISPTVAAALTLSTGIDGSAPSSIDLGPNCVISAFESTEPGSAGARRQTATCDDATMIITWEMFAPRTTAGPLMAERRKMVLRAETEDLQEGWLQPENGAWSAWRIMTSNDPAFVVAVSIWIDGKPVRPGLAMRTRMAMNSLFGSGFAPMVVTVTPMVEWQKLSGPARKQAAESVAAFLLQHRDIDRTVGALSAR